MDGVIAEMLKLGGDEMAENIQETLQNILHADKTPEDGQHVQNMFHKRQKDES